MKLVNSNLASAVRLALTLGVGAGMSAAAYAQNTDSPPPPSNGKAQNLDTVTVTGSNIRRVDMETANPVLTIDHAAIEKSGKVTLGDLVQDLPSIAGAAMNPNVNNGGGDGSARISLRGLGTNRSLLLINGHRVPSQMQDLNMIPISAVERVEVLSDGASAVYGSDAIGGVVNIITRTNYQGAEFGADYGISDRDDGERRAYHAMFGQTSDKGSIMLGLNYNKTDPVMAANRAYSHDALYKYSTGSVVHGGSSRTPTGRIGLPANSPIATALGCTSVTRIANTNGTLPSDYRCYTANDAYNFQAVGNYDQTPSERTGLFALGDYKLGDNVDVYAQVFHNKTVSRSQIAPVPMDTASDGMFIPSNQYYNPFGTAFGLGTAGYLRTRLVSLGDRQGDYSTTDDLATVGLKGSFADTSWNWNADFTYGKLSQSFNNGNYIDYPKLASNFGCTTAPGAGDCTPINIFDINDPATIALLQTASLNTYSHNMYQTKTAEGSVNGPLFALPAGDMQLAAGVSYRKEYMDTSVDSAITSTIDSNFNLTCGGPSSICSAPMSGGYNTKEAYAELFVPLLKELPGVYSLNVDLGDRYSKYNMFGSTNNWKFAIEYKPIEDLLLRGTVSKVFRAPTLTDLYRAPTGDSPTAQDPLAPNCLATGTCQMNGVVAGSVWAHNVLGTPNLQPENGKSYDYGFVYDPSWIPGLSINADYYRITLDNLIVSGFGIAQTLLNYCYHGGTIPNGATCSQITRSPQGTIQNVFETPINAGELDTKGADIGASYRLPETPIGNFRIAAQATYIQAYNITYGGITQGVAGHFDKTYGNFARWRGLGTLDWNLGSWSASWQMRYIGPIEVGYADDLHYGASAAADGAVGANGAYVNSPFRYGSYVYNNVSLGYNIEPINTMIQVGIDNLSDKQPPLFYMENVLNGNTDVSTYDTVGRFFWGKITVKF